MSDAGNSTHSGGADEEYSEDEEERVMREQDCRELEVDSVGVKRKRGEMAGSKGRVQRYLVTVEYVGTRFLGWQKQKNFRTVQGALEDAFCKFVGQPVVSAGSSRTDTGVHALANVCHVDIERISKRKPGEVLPPHEPEVVKRAVNHFLQRDAGDVAVVGVQCVPPDFHARFKARERTYHYRVLAGNGVLSVFEKDRAWHVPEDLNLAAMLEACQVLVGHHDFSSFRATGCQSKSPVKTLDELHVCEMSAWPSFPTQAERSSSTQGPKLSQQTNEASPGVHVEGTAAVGGKLSCPNGEVKTRLTTKARLRCYVVTARARSFLYHQVRLLVGLLKAVGSGALTVADVQCILEARTITATPAMAPACGLYLAEVKYNYDSDQGIDIDVEDVPD